MFKFLSYVRALFLTPFAAVWTIVSSVVVLGCIYLGFSKQALFYSIKNFWAKVILWASGVELEVRGQEKLPPGGFLYTFNHTSLFDILVIFAGTPVICYFGAKAELFSIPVFGTAAKAAGALRIERKNLAKVIQVYRDAEARVAQGDVFALAPEGTRQKGFGYLGPFKSGPFFFAVNSKMPIVPVVLVGCEKIITKESIFINWGQWKQKVIFDILDPIYPESTHEDEVYRLKDLTYQRMSEKLKQHWSPLS